ncbi:uncharacterized protein [Argopecten irradians]|uniref:uncharacterized protein isoform X6 n=1 Tax=Argopecten irradians TaxID=31199 RepID=UPI00371F0AA5
MNYQKFYTNGIHSSSLLCQLATMWKSQTLCDAIIKTGNINTKAHRLVLVAACPMLQSMDNASIGSHLEVRLASEIKQDSVNMFLQYLYEGFMMLTEDNHKDIEKIARLLQVDSVIKCCADFCKSLQEKTGLSVYSAGQYKYTSHDMLEFKHVRVSGIQKTVQDTMMKRHSDFQRPNSPGSKRPRMHRPGSPSDGPRGGDNMYGHSSHSDSDRVPRLGLGSFPGAAGRNLQPGVVEVIEDSLELVQTEPVERDPVTGRPLDSRPPVQKSVAISVASQVTGGDPDLQIVNVSGMKDSSSSRTQMSTATHTTSTPIARDSRGPSSHSSFLSQQSSQSRSDIPMPSSSRVQSDRSMPTMSRPDVQRSLQNQYNTDLQQQQQQKQSAVQYPSIPQALIDMDFSASKQKSSDVFPTSLQKSTDVFPTGLPKPSEVTFPGMSMSMSGQQNTVAQSKPFAAGSAGQANQSAVPIHINTSSSSSSPITSLPPVSPVIPDTSSFGMSASPKTSQPSSRSESLERPSSTDRLKEEKAPPTVDLVGPDISIVKIESTDKDETGALDMYVDTGDDGEVHPPGMEGDGDQTYEGSDYDVEEPPGEMEGSNEGSNLSGDQNAWYLNTMKGVGSQYVDGRSSKPYLPLASGPFFGSDGRQYARDLVINNVVHESVTTPESKRYKCVYCKSHNVRTRTGLPVDTRLHCSVCRVPLCRSRGCFLLFHQEQQFSNPGVKSVGNIKRNVIPDAIFTHKPGGTMQANVMSGVNSGIALQASLMSGVGSGSRGGDRQARVMSGISGVNPDVAMQANLLSSTSTSNPSGSMQTMSAIPCDTRPGVFTSAAPEVTVQEHLMPDNDTPDVKPSDTMLNWGVE